MFDGLGKLPGQYHIKLKTDVRPVQHAPRKVPVHLKPQLQEHLQQLEQKGVIARVTEPSEWISSIMVGQKLNKLIVCLDPKDLHQALERARYLISTVEEVMPQLAKSKVFSKLDAKDSFCQVMLDEDSRYNTTFWTLFGQYR